VNELLAIVGVDRNQPALQFGLVAGASPVSKQKERIITNFPLLRGYAYGTADFFKLDRRRDPLRALLPGQAQPDGQEWIFGLPKVHRASGTRGALQAYFLSNAQEKVVDVAPVTLVEDYTEFRGYREISCGGSCFSCHNGGLNPISENKVRNLLEAGVRLKALYPNDQGIDLFHLSDLQKEIDRDNEDFAAIVTIACDCTPNAAATSFLKAVNTYDLALTVEEAARELYIEPAEVPLAIAWANARGIDLGERLPLLAHNIPIPRDAFEEVYRTGRGAIDAWRLSAPHN
jgi:hypothetical protein